MYEGPNIKPTNLDACGGHYGPVPATTLSSDNTTFPAASYVYHYHVQDKPPYTVGCFGPVSSLEQARSLYTTCTSSVTNWTSCTSKGLVRDYALDCPVFSMGNRTFNPMAPQPTADCPSCNGSCPGAFISGAEGNLAGAAAGAVCALAMVLLARSPL
jgi:hypothetical protein